MAKDEATADPGLRIPPPGGTQLPSVNGPVESPKPGRSAAYWANLLMLVALSVGTSLWFTRHLESYVNQVVLLGGGVSLWAMLRMAWTFLEKTTKTDPWDWSRRLLSSAEASRILIAALLLLATLWLSTGSLYFDYDGAGGNRYTVQVLHDDAASRTLPLAQRPTFSADAELSSSERTKGGVFYWQTSATALLCVLQKTGVPYEPRDCSIRPGTSIRTRVPGDFRLKRVHLLRIIPSIGLYAQLPGRDAPRASVAYRLTIKVGDKVQVVDDLRRGVVYIGGLVDEMGELMGLQSEAELKATLRDELIAKGVSATSADQSVAVLAGHAQVHGGQRLDKGQVLNLLVEELTLDGERVTGATPIGAPLLHTITDEKVQTLWLPNP